MNPDKVDRARVRQLTDLPNVGKAAAADLRLLGIHTPDQLAGACPFDLYDRLCRKTQRRHDPCVIDVFMSVIGFMNGEVPRPWWEFTGIRKRHPVGAGWHESALRCVQSPGCEGCSGCRTAVAAFPGV